MSVEDQWVDEIPEKTPDLLVCDGSGEWSALYVHGILDRVGDHYLIDERIRELTGVVTLQTDDFLRGGDKRHEVAPDIDMLREYRTQRRDREERAAALRQQAQRLLEEADSLAVPAPR
jgi:hypothetical protein